MAEETLKKQVGGGRHRDCRLQHHLHIDRKRDRRGVQRRQSIFKTAVGTHSVAIRSVERVAIRTDSCRARLRFRHDRRLRPRPLQKDSRHLIANAVIIHNA